MLFSLLRCAHKWRLAVPPSRAPRQRIYKWTFLSDFAIVSDVKNRDDNEIAKTFFFFLQVKTTNKMGESEMEDTIITSSWRFDDVLLEFWVATFRNFQGSARTIKFFYSLTAIFHWNFLCFLVHTFIVSFFYCDGEF